MEERRKTIRNRTLLGGQVIFNEHASVMDCRVRNLSAEGAKLNFSGAAVIPYLLQLTIAPRPEPVRARVIWRAGENASVAFA